PCRAANWVSWTRRSIKKELVATKRASRRSLASVANAASISRTLLALRTLDLQPHGARSRSHVSHRGLGDCGLARIDEQGYARRSRDKLVQKFQPLRRYLHHQVGCAGNVAARPVKAGDEAELDGVRTHFEDDRNGRGRRLRRLGRRSAGRSNYGHLTMNQIVCQRRQIFDRDVLTLDKAGLFQTLTERDHELRRVAGRPGAKESDHRH